MTGSSAVRRAAFMLSLSVVTCAGQSAQAEKSPLPIFLVLGFSRDGRQDAVARDKVASVLRPFGDVRQPELADKDMGCQTRDCLAPLARSFDSADYIVIGSISPAVPSAPDSRKVVVTIYKVATWQGGRESSDCTGCSEAVLYQQLVEHAEALLKAQGLQKPKRCSLPYWTTARGLAQGAFGGLAVSGLVGGVAVSGADGQTPIVGSGSSSINLMPHLGGYSAIGYSALATGLAGSIVTAIWGRTSANSQGQHQCSELPSSRWSYARGVAVGATATLFVSSLISAVALQSAQGQACIAGRSDITCSYYPAPGGVAWAFSGIWAIGLGLSFAL